MSHLRTRSIPTVSLADVSLAALTWSLALVLMAGAPLSALQPPVKPQEPTQPSPEEVAPPPDPGQVADPELGLEQILAKHLAARVPPDAGKVQTVKAMGIVGFQGMQLPMTMHFQRPRPFRVDIDLQGMSMVQAYDGTTAWTVSPFQGIVEPEALGPEAEDAVTVFSDFLWGLLDDAEDKGISLTLAGIENVDNDETYRIEATLASGKTRQIFLGGEDFLEHRLTLDTEFMGAPQTLVATLDDYRSVGPLVIPHRIVISGAAMQIDMTLEAVETGVEVDPGLFTMPEPVEVPVEPTEGEAEKGPEGPDLEGLS